MTDENELEGQSRRKFLKTTGAVGVAATGVGAFGGQAAAQPSVTIDDVSQLAEGLITVQVSGIAVTALNNNNVDVTVTDIEAVKDIDVTVQDVNVANAGQNLVNIEIVESEILNITDNAVSLVVGILGGGSAGSVASDSVTIDPTSL